MSSSDDDEVLRILNERVLVLDARCPCYGCDCHLVAGEQAQVRRALMSDGDLGSWTSCLECVATEAADEGSRDGLADALAQIQDSEDDLDSLPEVSKADEVGDVIGRLSAGWRATVEAMAVEGRR